MGAWAAKAGRGQYALHQLPSGKSRGTRFCETCGEKLAQICPQCGHASSADAKFCGACGVLLANPATASPPPLPAPILYTPPHLAERIRAERAAMEAKGTDAGGERKTITALFADMAGSTALIQDLDPEEARSLIDPVIALMMEAVHHYEATCQVARRRHPGAVRRADRPRGPCAARPLCRPADAAGDARA